MCDSLFVCQRLLGGVLFSLILLHHVSKSFNLERLKKLNEAAWFFRETKINYRALTLFVTSFPVSTVPRHPFYVLGINCLWNCTNIYMCTNVWRLYYDTLQMKSCGYATLIRAWIPRLDKNSCKKGMVSNATVLDVLPLCPVSPVSEVRIYVAQLCRWLSRWQSGKMLGRCFWFLFRKKEQSLGTKCCDAPPSIGWSMREGGYLILCRIYHFGQGLFSLIENKNLVEKFHNLAHASFYL